MWMYMSMYRGKLTDAKGLKSLCAGGLHCFFFSSSWLTNVNGMKDLWCSSTVRLLSTQIRVNVKILSILVELSCY